MVRAVFLKGFRDLKVFGRQRWESNFYPIRFYNFWDQSTKENWFYRFIMSRKLLENCPDCRINFYSTFGPLWNLNSGRRDVRIFYTGENVRKERFARFGTHGLDRGMNLAMGFEYLADDRYLRFPLWLLYMFPPESNEYEIINKCSALSNPGVFTKTKFASLLARHDLNGIRTEIFFKMQTVGRIDCDAKLLHNNDDLKSRFNDQKSQYLKNYKFNICPENSDCSGYVTEKLFEAIESGCIPVYWGSENKPEPDVLNHEAILFWKEGEDNSALIQKVKLIHENESSFREFSSQPRLLPSAGEYVIDRFQRLEKALKILMKENSGRGGKRT